MPRYVVELTAEEHELLLICVLKRIADLDRQKSKVMELHDKLRTSKNITDADPTHAIPVNV